MTAIICARCGNLDDAERHWRCPCRRPYDGAAIEARHRAAVARAHISGWATARNRPLGEPGTTRRAA